MKKANEVIEENRSMITDASPYEDADFDTLAGLLQSKAIRLNAILTGDCVEQNSWNMFEENP